jgi:hypothetical protein
VNKTDGGGERGGDGGDCMMVRGGDVFTVVLVEARAQSRDQAHSGTSGDVLNR